MAKYTLDEKLDYNKKNKSEFSSGYVIGVTGYRDYIKANKEYRKTIRGIIDTASSGAQKGDALCKGIMCGVRDAANERKNKNKKK